MSVQIKVMTFNLRLRNEKDGVNCFDFRRDKILRVLEREKPDLIGFQEATDPMRDWLKENLRDYYVLGHGRAADYKGEGIPIAFRKDIFELHAFHEEWLSLAPQKPASRIEGLDQSHCPRVLACAELIHRESDLPIAFFNIHTDHKGKASQTVECAMLCQKLEASPFRFAVTGDFNAYPDSEPIGLVLSTAQSLGTVDATAHIKGSFHGFTGEVKDRKIDYIFTNLSCDSKKSYAVPDDNACGHFYSDHLALCAYLEI